MFYREAGSQSLLKKYDGWTHLIQKPVFLPNFRRFNLVESEPKTNPIVKGMVA
jgi:hypothetical protein